MLDAFSSMGHYSRELFDDIADSITYANNYLAPVRAPTDEVRVRVLLSVCEQVCVYLSVPSMMATLTDHTLTQRWHVHLHS